MRHGHLILIAVLTGSGLLTGCGRSEFLDTMGYGKYSPDESQVREQNSLVMPPSLALQRPGPGTTAAEPEGAPQTLAGSQPVTTTPPSYGAPTEADNTPSQAFAPPPVPQQDQPTSQAALQPQPAPDPQQSVYDRYGISTVHPDGRQKTRGELRNELRAKILEEKRKSNPNYGTIFNAGSMWGE